MEATPHAEEGKFKIDSKVSKNSKKLGEVN